MYNQQLLSKLQNLKKNMLQSREHQQQIVNDLNLSQRIASEKLRNVQATKSSLYPVSLAQSILKASTCEAQFLSEIQAEQRKQQVRIQEIQKSLNMKQASPQHCGKKPCTEEPITSYISARNSQPSRPGSPPLMRSQFEKQFDEIDQQVSKDSPQNTTDTPSFDSKETQQTRSRKRTAARQSSQDTTCPVVSAANVAGCSMCQAYKLALEEEKKKYQKLLQSYGRAISEIATLHRELQAEQLNNCNQKSFAKSYMEISEINKNLNQALSQSYDENRLLIANKAERVRSISNELEQAKWEISRLRITNSFLGHALQQKNRICKKNE